MQRRGPDGPVGIRWANAPTARTPRSSRRLRATEDVAWHGWFQGMKMATSPEKNWDFRKHIDTNGGPN